MARCEFFYDFSSPFAYLAATQIERVCAGHELVWRPFLLGGLFKAIGARRQQILNLFLVEALTLSVAGAGIGVALGVALIAVAAGLWPNFPIEPSPVWIGVVLALSLAAGSIFGLLPARRAAALSAADALRGRM